MNDEKDPRNQLLKLTRLLKKEERRKKALPAKKAIASYATKALCTATRPAHTKAHVAVRRQSWPLLESCRARETELVEWKREGEDGCKSQRAST